ncbi:MAG: TIM barrel protein [Cellulosilyticaceae bacterium]
MNSTKHLNYIFANIQSERLDFCYDSGHEYYNHPETDCLSRYGDKLFAVHLDDNFGDDDTHLLPFDGAVDWNKAIISTSQNEHNAKLVVEY